MSYNGNIGNLLQGVSQQAPRDRLAGQHTLQRNMTCDPINSLSRRAPARLVRNILTDAAEYSITDFVQGGVLYTAMIKTGAIHVTRASDGQIIIITLASGASSYLTGTSFRTATLGDETFVLNTTRAAAMDTGVTNDDYPENRAYVWCLGGQFSSKYTVRLKVGETIIVATYTTPDGTLAAHTAETRTENIITELFTAFTTAPLAASMASAGITVVQSDDHLMFTCTSETPMFVKVDDDAGGTLLKRMKNNVIDVSDLPVTAAHGTIARITGIGESKDDDYFVRFNSETPGATVGSNFGTAGVWEEWVGRNVVLGLDAATLPHKLVITGLTGTLSPVAWDVRSVGSEKSNPDPSFVGGMIRDIGTFSKRLVFLTKDTVVMSRTDKPTNFFRETATQVVPDDPVDISNKVLDTGDLHSMLAVNRDLVVMSSKAQFIVYGTPSVTPSTSMVLTTQYETDSGARPVAAGNSVYFGYASGRFTGIREFIASTDPELNVAPPLTDNVSKYIAGRLKHLTISSNFSWLFVHATENENSLYSYEYLLDGDNRVQSAWSEWVFEMDKVKHSVVENNILYVTLHTPENHYLLCSIDLDPQEDLVGYVMHLDRLAFRSGIYSVFFTDYTVDEDDLVVIQGEGCPFPGLLTRVIAKVGNEVTLEDDMGGGTVYYGIRYRSSFVPTMPFYRDRQGTRVENAILTLSEWEVSYEETGYIAISIETKYRDAVVSTFEGRVLDDPDNLLGVTAVSSGTFVIGVGDNSQDVTLTISSDHHTPMRILDMDYRGQVTRSGTRLYGSPA